MYVFRCLEHSLETQEMFKLVFFKFQKIWTMVYARHRRKTSTTWALRIQKELSPLLRMGPGMSPLFKNGFKHESHTCIKNGPVHESWSCIKNGFKQESHTCIKNGPGHESHTCIKNGSGHESRSCIKNVSLLQGLSLRIILMNVDEWMGLDGLYCSESQVVFTVPRMLQ